MKNTHFSVTCLQNITPIWFEDDFRGIIFDFYKQKIRNVVADDMPLKRCKRNWYDTFGLSVKMKSFTVCVSFFVGHINECSDIVGDQNE